MSIQDVNVKDGKKYRYRVYYLDKETNEKKQKCSKYYNTYNEAREAEIDFLYSLSHEDNNKAPSWKKDKKLDFHTVYMQWFDWSVTGRSLAARSIEDKQRIVEIYFSDLLPLQIEEITTEDIQRCLSADHFRELSTSRKNRVLCQIKSIFKYAHDYLKVSNDPTEYFTGYEKTDEEQLKEVEILEPWEFDIFLKHVPLLKSDYRNLYYVLYWTGMRLNEANSLTFNDVYNHTIHIYRQWDKDRDQWSTLKTKNAKRNISIDEKTEEAIRRQFESYRNEKDFSMDWFIFGGPRQLPYTNIEREKNKACLSAGLKKVKVHSFRHAHASYLLNHGVPLFKVSRRLGHSSVAMTADIYGHLIANDDDDILNAIKSHR